ncbi:thiamine diphosphokinase, partial [bacterium]
RSAGRDPDVVVGDLDSISSGSRLCAADLRHRPDQDWTDADKVLAEIIADGWNEASICGLEGDLPDHELAALGSCVRALDRGLRLSLLYRRGKAWIVSPPHPFAMPVEAGRRISVMPLMPGTDLEVEGVVWPLKAPHYGLLGVGSVSNRSRGGEVQVRVKTGAVWVFVGDSQPVRPD